MKQADFNISVSGSLVLFLPQTGEAKQWLVEHTADEAQWWGGALAVEPRYASDLAKGILADCED